MCIRDSNSVGEMTIEMFSDLSGRMTSSALCGSVCSKPQSRLCCRRGFPAEPPQSPRGCQQLSEAGGGSGQGAQVCAVKQQDAMGSDIPAAVSQAIHIYALMCDGGGEDANPME